MNSEVYFLKYAFPCSHIIYKIRKEISYKEFKKMEYAAENNISLDKKFLERVFFRAFERIKKLAKEMKKDKWDIEVIKRYFRVKHNSALENSDYPKDFKELCKVYIGTIVNKSKNKFTVEYNNKEKRIVNNVYIKNAKLGDKVTIHWKNAIEKV